MSVDPNKRKVCANCHGAVKMKDELKEKGLLGPDPWQDGFQELMHYLWHYVGRRARQGAAMNAPDYAHWHGCFQLFRCCQDMENIYNRRLETGEVEKYSPVISSAAY